ncbi:MAG: patatin-like phospholipase family protein [Limnobacter sp.]|nr:patatin-like phospholipase family protein [Limnobacter sp.]
MVRNNLMIIAGEKAQQHIAQHGLSPDNICAIPAAAGGPKGLILQGLDHFLFQDFFSQDVLEKRTQKGIAPLELIGASIGAWRMAAAASNNPSKVLNRLADQYCDAQRYAKNVNRQQITEVCNAMVKEVLGSAGAEICQPTGKQLMVWVNRGKPTLYKPRAGVHHEPRKGGFASAVFSNAWNRNKLATYFERWVFHSGSEAPAWLSKPYDGIPGHFAQLSASNLHSALLASGSIPFVLDAVPHIQHHNGNEVFEGPFWDGGLTDYHLALPFHRKEGIVLYPHFSNTVTPGWLDKFLKIRKAKPEWMSNVVLICPTPEFVARLPAKKVPDRSDFKRYGVNHDLRIKHWRLAIAESHRLADDLSNWLQKINKG